MSKLWSHPWKAGERAFTVNQESRYLIISNVPAVHYQLTKNNPESLENQLLVDLLKLCSSFGAIEEYRCLGAGNFQYGENAQLHGAPAAPPNDFVDDDDFAESFWIKYQKLAAARMAKLKLNETPFYSYPLHVRYAPEFESLEDTKRKLKDRLGSVLYRRAGVSLDGKRRKGQSEIWIDAEQHPEPDVHSMKGEEMSEQRLKANVYSNNETVCHLA